MFDPRFIALLGEAVGAENAATALAAFEEDASVSIRLNPSKPSFSPPENAVPVPWSPYGYLLKERPAFTLDPLFHAGALSSSFPVMSFA